MTLMQKYNLLCNWSTDGHCLICVWYQEFQYYAHAEFITFALSISLYNNIFFPVNLSQVGNNNEDSSSEETSPVGGKPAIRPRSTSIDRSHIGYFLFCVI